MEVRHDIATPGTVITFRGGLYRQRHELQHHRLYHHRQHADTGFGERLVGEWCEHHGLIVDVRDSIGAGDSFTAAVTMGLLNRWPLAKISEVATEVAAYVCSCSGAVPSLPPAILTHYLPETAII